MDISVCFRPQGFIIPINKLQCFRYVLIVHPTWYSRVFTRRNIIIMLIFAWGFGFALMILPLFGIWGHLGYDHRSRQCTFINVHEGESTPKTFLICLGVMLPCAILIVFYSLIFWKVRQSRLVMEAHT